MNICSKWIGITSVAALMLLPAATVQAQRDAQQSASAPEESTEAAISAEEFREAMIEWAAASEATERLGDDLASKLALLSDEQVEAWLAMIPDPERFIQSMQNVVNRVEAPPGDDRRRDADVPVPSTPYPATTLFPPDYPPGTGAYYDTIISGIAGFGITGATNTNRCDNTSWGDYVGVWWPLNTTFDALDGACVVAGCDPIGIACAITCGILEVAKVALKVAAVPLEACDVHQGAIDGAELEATYENTKGLVGDVAHVHSDLAAHDTNIDADLMAHDANIDADLVAHDANIDADLIAHDANIDADLIAHDANIDADLIAHDLNIDTDLQNHDTDIKALVGDVQDFLDNKVELRQVHMQVLQVVQRERYLVSTQEAGLPVNVVFTAIEGFSPGASAFAPMPSATVVMLEPGLYDLQLNLNARNVETVFRLRVRHDEEVDHFGEILFHVESADTQH